MHLVLRIAWRNLFRHKGKSAVIGGILFTGALIMTLGNGVIAGMEAGLEKHIVDGFTGDLVLVSDRQENDNVLLTMMGKAVEPIHDYPEIAGALRQVPAVERFLPAGLNMAVVLNEEGGAPSYAMLLGVDFARYAEMFPGRLEAVEGRLLGAGERGALVPTGARKELYNMTGLWFQPRDEPFDEERFRAETGETGDVGDLKIKDTLVFMGYNERNTTLDVRLDVRGVVRFLALNTIFGHYSFVDIASYRESQGYFPAAARSAALEPERERILALEGEGLDALFGEEPIVAAAEPAVAAPTAEPPIASGPRADELADDREEGTYNVVFVRLAPGVEPAAGLERVNAALAGAGLEVRAVPWRRAFGMLGSMATIIKGALFVFVTLLFVVAVIIIVNTLTMAALERVPEIGMMRAVGARRGFVGAMFLAESGILAAACGGAGILAGTLIVNVVPRLGITSANDLVQLLFGGDVFHPVLDPPDLLLTVLQLALVTVLAVIYPARVARGISPLDAVTRD